MKAIQVVVILRVNLQGANVQETEAYCQSLAPQLLSSIPGGQRSTTTVEYTVSEVQTNNDTQQESTHMWQVIFNDTVSYKGDNKERAIQTFGSLMVGVQQQSDHSARIILLQDGKGIQQFHNLSLTSLAQTVP